MLHSLSLVLPCYNEQENISHVVADVQQWMHSEKIDGEIICVNDGSTDDTASLLHGLAAEDDRIRIVTREKNGGYGIAVRAGLDVATKETIGFMDSDRQFRAQDISLLLPYLAQVDFVTGRRRTRADSMLRNVFGKMLGLLTWVTFGLWVRDVNCGMKVFRRSLWPNIRPEYSVEKFFNTEIFLNLQKHAVPWEQIDVPHYPRIAGTPTGASLRVIGKMFIELYNLRRSRK